MTQHQLDREVATTLGEDIREVSRRGFSIADPADVYFDPEPDLLMPNIIDWDDFDLHR